MLVLTLLVAASAEAKAMNLGTALRYASTAPLPDVSASTGQPPLRLNVSECKRRSRRAFTCRVEVAYAPVPQSGPAQTGAAAAEYQVRVFYPTRHSTTPHVKVVGAVHVVG
ncbi:MAG: hypothetical protein M3Z33_08945 [Actinomycetota bacterium]|nr:hypothetical protein [Actinomycetota bacterium]